jgi:hypothetical protein
MARETIDLSVPAVVPSKQREPQIPTIEFSEKTKESFAGFVGRAVLPQVLSTLNSFLSTRARSDIQAKLQEKTRENWNQYRQDILNGKDINAVVEKSEANIKSFLNKQKGMGLHHAYWATVLQDETLQKHRAGLLQAAAEDAATKQREIIERDYKTQWLSVDADPSTIFEALDVVERLKMDVLNSTGSPEAAAQQTSAWQDELSLTAITRASESSIAGGQETYGRLVDKMSIGAIKKAQSIMRSAAAEHTRINEKMIGMQESNQRIDTIMRGADSDGNPVFIDPDNKQYQRDMENDYALYKLRAANGDKAQDFNASMTETIRSYAERVRRTGIVPEDYASDLRSHLNSGDIGLMKMAAADIEGITRSGVKLSRKIDSQLIADSETIMRWARSGVTDDVIMQRMIDYRKNRVEHREYREKTYGDALKDNKNYIRDVTRRTFATSWGFGTPTTPGEYQVAAAEAVKHYYTYQGMEFKDAIAATAKDLRQTWGTTTKMDGSKEIMLYPPEMVYPGPTVDNILRSRIEETELRAAAPAEEYVTTEEAAELLESYKSEHWTAVALQEEMKEWKLKKKYDPKKIYLDFAGTDTEREQVIYRLMYRNEDGGIEEILTERDGAYQPAMWYPSRKYFIKYYRAQKNKNKMSELAEGLRAIHHGG